MRFGELFRWVKALLISYGVTLKGLNFKEAMDAFVMLFLTQRAPMLGSFFGNEPEISKNKALAKGSRTMPEGLKVNKVGKRKRINVYGHTGFMSLVNAGLANLEK